MALLSTPPALAPLIDHSLLAPGATPDHVRHWCQEAQRYGFAAVCVNPCHVRLAREELGRSKVELCTVIGFPTGATTSAVKLYEAQEAVENGATELDVVINLAWAKTGQGDLLYRELAEICEATGVPVKVILEMGLLTPPEVALAVAAAMDAGARFLKTSTGWNGGATVEGVRQLVDLAQGQVGIKASGGIRTAAQALELVTAGATRLGTSQGPAIVREQEEMEVA